MIVQVTNRRLFKFCYKYNVHNNKMLERKGEIKINAEKYRKGSFSFSIGYIRLSVLIK